MLLTPRSTVGRAAWLLLLALLARDGLAQSPSPPEVEGTTPAAPTGDSQAEPAAEADPCAAPLIEGGQWIDLTRDRLFRSVCVSARWFDGFFGDARFDHQITSTLFGRAGLGLWWSEHDRYEVPSDFRANIPLPNLHERFDVTVARENEDEFVEGRLEGRNVAPDFVTATEGQAWLAGLGYTPIAGRNSRMRYSVGVRLTWPPAPFVQARYGYYHFFSHRSALRLRETAFWRLDDGFGATTAAELEHLLGPTRFVRWSNVATVSEASRGIRWRSDVTLYQDLPGPRALAYTVLVRGETDAPVPLERWSLRTVIRQQMLREWFFVELGAGVSWPRRRVDDPRTPSWGVGIRFEVFFGQWPDGPLPGGGFD